MRMEACLVFGVNAKGTQELGNLDRFLLLASKMALFEFFS
jgi:hypothetical protein